MVHEIVLQNTDDSTLQTLLSETWSSAVLDSGASSTVCRKPWFDEFLNSIPTQEQSKIKYYNSSKPFHFGDGRQIKSLQSATIPAIIGQRKINIKTDIIDSDIPLLLSKTAMKNAQITLNFDNDTISFKGDEIPLYNTSNGLYSLPITTPKQLINNCTNNKLHHEHITLKITNPKTNHDIAIKLHRSFAHPSSDKLLKLVNNAGPQWSNNKDLKKEIINVTQQCQVCKIYKKSPPRPVASLPMASNFQETVAMDLKKYKGRLILHLVDLCTRLSAATFIPNKNKETVLREIFKIWIAIFGTPQKILIDNGGEFANDELTEMCGYLGIHLHTTAAESPWSNGVVERNNQTLSNMMDKITEDLQCSTDLALLWALNAKNSLQNVAGFSPFQLVLGYNPKLPSTTSDNLPALSMKTTSQILQDNLNAMHKARTAFIASENDERIKRALSHNVRTSSEIRYITGDTVLYKRDSSNEWRGPGVVIGQVSQQVFVKHGSFYIRVHPCRLQLIKPASREIDPNTNRQHIEPSSPNAETNADAETPTTTEQNHIIPSDSDDDYPNKPEENTNDCSNISETPTYSSKQQFRPNTHFRYKLSPEDSWTSATTINRAGKASGKNKHWWNICKSDGSTLSLDLSKPTQLEIINETDQKQNEDQTQNEEQVIDEIYIAQSKSDELKAKEAELNQWKVRHVYEEIEDCSKDCISLRWVIKPKIIDNKPGLKARLCAHGFEEEQNYHTDSPTCSREGIRIMISLTSSKKWAVNSIDVKTAFLQGKDIERRILVRPPKEAKTSKIWSLNKCVYDLADAPRYWYLTVREELCKLGVKPSKYDQGIFYYYKNEDIIGIIILFVDDFLWAGTQEFSKIINKFKEKFHIGVENNETFTYVGIKLKQNKDKTILIDQFTYIDSINTIPLNKEQISNPQRETTEEERSALRSTLGQLNWLSNITCPEISFQVSTISSRITKATVSDIKEVNKIVKNVKGNKHCITFPSLDLSSTHVVMFSDASFNNHPNGSSQGGYIVMIVDKHNQSCPISWKSNKVRRIARSTLAAETLVFTDGCDAAYFINQLAQEAQIVSSDSQILTYTDNKSLHDSVNTTAQVTDRRLRVEISAIREMQEKEEITIKWISKEKQLADCLTKRGAPCSSLVSVLQTGSTN